MAVENKYVNTKTAAGKLAQAAQAAGQKLITMIQTFELAAADDDGSVYRLFKDVPSTLIPVGFEIAHDAITGGTDFDLGLYATDLGAEVDKDLLMDGQTLAVAATLVAPKNGLSNVDLANIGKMLYELAGKTVANRPLGYDIALTANTVGSAAGTITVVSHWINP